MMCRNLYLAWKRIHFLPFQLPVLVSNMKSQFVLFVISIIVFIL